MEVNFYLPAKEEWGFVNSDEEHELCIREYKKAIDNIIQALNNVNDPNYNQLVTGLVNSGLFKAGLFTGKLQAVYYNDPNADSDLYKQVSNTMLPRSVYYRTSASPSFALNDLITFNVINFKHLTRRVLELRRMRMQESIERTKQEQLEQEERAKHIASVGKISLSTFISRD